MGNKSFYELVSKFSRLEVRDLWSYALEDRIYFCTQNLNVPGQHIQELQFLHQMTPAQCIEGNLVCTHPAQHRLSADLLPVMTEQTTDSFF